MAAAGRFLFAVTDSDTENERRDGVVVWEDDQRVDQLAQRPTIAAFGQFLQPKNKTINQDADDVTRPRVLECLIMRAEWKKKIRPLWPAR